MLQIRDCRLYHAIDQRLPIASKWTIRTQRAQDGSLSFWSVFCSTAFWRDDLAYNGLCCEGLGSYEWYDAGFPRALWTSFVISWDESFYVTDSNDGVCVCLVAPAMERVDLPPRSKDGNGFATTSENGIAYYCL